MKNSLRNEIELKQQQKKNTKLDCINLKHQEMTNSDKKIQTKQEKRSVEETNDNH